MSRQRTLLDKFEGNDDTWITGLCVANIPSVMLENSFIRSLCSVINGTLAEACIENDDALRTLDISKNK
jgi:hypothetical protein